MLVELTRRKVVALRTIEVELSLTVEDEVSIVVKLSAQLLLRLLPLVHFTLAMPNFLLASRVRFTRLLNALVLYALVAAHHVVDRGLL